MGFAPRQAFRQHFTPPQQKQDGNASVKDYPLLPATQHHQPRPPRQDLRLARLLPQRQRHCRAIKSVNIPGWQSKIGATYFFKVEDGSSFLVDLKNAEGATKGGVHYTETAPATPADVTVTATTANLLKMFNREMEAVVMVEEGKVHLAGEIEKAITLQKVLIELREGEKLHYYLSVKDIIARFKTVNLPGWKTKVGATFYFDTKDGEKFLVDLKTIDGASKGGVIEGVCPTTITPDVTVTTTAEHLLKMFNREGDSIKMIVEGHVKVTGEFDKLLSLKEVMIAAREAESH